MLFPTILFAVFFGLVYALQWAMASRPELRKRFLLVASYVFYGAWDWQFLGLLAASSLVNHAAALALARREPDRRPALLALAVAFNLGLLGFFKYYGFLYVNAAGLCGRLGAPCPLPPLDIVLPVGISFFTFQALSYVLDVARGQLAPAESWLDFALYLAFFPQLVAGPIVRAAELFPQIARPPRPERLPTGRATVLILAGLFKKVVVANWLASELVDPVYDNPELFGRWDALLAVYGYAVQLYCDFSAYSDIAIGVGLLLGFRLPNNFDAPYLASTVQEFWRRWHISLSTWLRDYVYVPLGGSRGPGWRTSANLVLTFLLGGLWHGAGWNFVFWGLLHGVYLAIERAVWARRGGAAKAAATRSPAVRLALALLTFHLVGLTYVFFRAPSFGDAGLLLRALLTPASSTRFTPALAAVLAAGFALQWLDGGRSLRLAAGWQRQPVWLQGAAAAAAVAAIFALGPRGVAPFIYFQF